MLLVAEGLTKLFGGVAALSDVDFEVDAGEVVALVGDNGAGKSTLIKALFGAQPADSGSIWIDGEPVSIRSPQAAFRLGIRPLDVGTLRDVRAPVGRLSGGQRQAVAIARSLLGAPRLVILDEPTAALGVAETAEVLAPIHRLRERGLGVVVISHNLDTVFDVADRIVVLRLGRASRRSSGARPASRSSPRSSTCARA